MRSPILIAYTIPKREGSPDRFLSVRSCRGVVMSRSFRTLAVHAFTAAVFSATAIAQQHLPPWQPSPGHQQFPIWPGAAPDSVVYDGPEYSVKVDDDLVAAKPWISDERVSVPTMTV